MLAKSRDWATKELLLKMIEWRERITRGRVHDTDCAGKHVRMSEDVWQELHQAFARFDREESWGAALATMSLFRRLATETGATLGFAYAVDLDKNISRFILGLRDADRGNAS